MPLSHEVRMGLDMILFGAHYDVADQCVDPLSVRITSTSERTSALTTDRNQPPPRYLLVIASTYQWGRQWCREVGLPPKAVRICTTSRSVRGLQPWTPMVNIGGPEVGLPTQRDQVERDEYLRVINAVDIGAWPGGYRQALIDSLIASAERSRLVTSTPS